MVNGRSLHSSGVAGASSSPRTLLLRQWKTRLQLAPSVEVRCVDQCLGFCPTPRCGAFDGGSCDFFASSFALARTTGVDLVVVPGMGFDRGLRRLGHGGGFYDSYIRRASEFMSNTALAEPASEAQVNGRAAPLPRGTRPYLVGLACPEQMLEKVPTGPNVS